MLNELHESGDRHRFAFHHLGGGALAGADCSVDGSVRLGAVIRRFGSVGEQLPLDLHDSKQERRTDAEEQHTVHRLERTQHLEPRRHHKSLDESR
jgi:hypothetical protein